MSLILLQPEAHGLLRIARMLTRMEAPKVPVLSDLDSFFLLSVFETWSHYVSLVGLEPIVDQASLEFTEICLTVSLVLGLKSRTIMLSSFLINTPTPLLCSRSSGYVESHQHLFLGYNSQPPIREEKVQAGC